MKSILVPTNFSTSSKNAATYAADMALAIHADLHLLYVLQFPLGTGEMTLTQEVYNEMKKAGKEALKKLKADLQEQTKGKINIVTALEIGTIEYQLEKYCKKQNPFLVIMGREKNPSDIFMFGSSTLFAAKHLHYPLLAIPDGTIFRSINKIVLACDLKNGNENIPVEYLKELRNTFHAVLEVITVSTKKIEQIKSSNEFISLSNLLHDLYPTYYFNIANSVEEGIKKFIVEHNADLLLLLPKHHGFFDFHKSHTKKMILNADMPIMAIHE